MARGQKRTKGSSGYNRKNTEDFLARNRNKPGVIETESGLQYLQIEAGSDAFVSPDSIVEVHHRISLLDGTLIEDTYKTGESVEFVVSEALEGYREGLVLTGIGGRSRLFLPPELAWGKRGSGKRIGPYALLIIDVRLLDIR